MMTTPNTDFVDQLEIRRSSLSPARVWAFFDTIVDVPNLTPAEEQGVAWGAIVDGGRIGMVVVDTVGTPFVSRIAVKPDARCAGVGTALLEHLLDEYGRLRCRVRKDNTPGLRLVESVGFHRVGEGRYGELWRYDTVPEA